MRTLVMTRRARLERIINILNDAERLVSAAALQMEETVPLASLNIRGPSLYYYSDIIRALQEAKHFCMANIAEPENGSEESE